jgi:hypothetical protein
MAKLSLPEGAEIVDGSIRFQATDDPDETISQLLGKPFTEEECAGVREFLLGNLSLKKTVSQHLGRFQNREDTTRLLVRIWMLTRFGGKFSSALDQMFKSVEAEHEDFSVVFMKLFQQLEEFRKRSTELDVRRPPAVERVRLNVEKSLGRRIYKFDVDTQDKPIEHAATEDRKDPVLRQHIENLRRFAEDPSVRKSTAGIEDFLLGRKSLQNTIASMVAMPVASVGGEVVSQEERQISAISNLVGAWVAVAFDLEWDLLRGHVRRLLGRGVPPLEELFYGICSRFALVADLEELNKLHHSTATALLKYVLDQQRPTEAEQTSLSSMNWKLFNGDSVPKEERPAIVEKIMQTFQETE